MNAEKKSEGFLVVPRGEHPCLWMMAGVIAYKLCRRDYHCDTCPLDTEMRQAAGEEEKNSVEIRILNEPVFYSPQHTWVRLKGSRNQPPAEVCNLLVNGKTISLAAPITTLIGLDDFILRLLSRIEGVVLPPLATQLARGSILAKLLQEAGDFPVASPLSGTVIRINMNLLNRPNLLPQNPTLWLAQLRPTNLTAETRDLLDGREALAWQQRENRKLETLLGTLSKEDRERLGATMHDGRGKADSLLAIVGPERYKRIVLSFLQGEFD